MLGESRLLSGLLAEGDEAVRTQVELWDRSNVIQAAWDKAAGSETVRNVGSTLREKVVRPFAGQVRDRLKDILPQSTMPVAERDSGPEHPLDGHVMKFSRLLEHSGLRLDHAPTEAELHDLCLQIERDAVRVLREADDRTLVARLRRQARSGFEGTTTDDLVRHVIQRTFEQLDAEFQGKSPAEQEAIAAKIAAALRNLPPEEQERIRKAARLPDLTAETLRQTGMLAGLGFGVSGMVGLAGFTAYTTLTSVVAGVVGLAGIHLSFGTYVMLTSGLAGLSNPFLFVPAVLGGATWMTSKANRSIRNILYPTFVATSVMSHTVSDTHLLPSAEFAGRTGDLVAQIGTSSGQRLASLVARFPALGRPSLAARLASHVAG
jgi:hypothetical protein